jgi:hypothetical protein
VVDETVEDMQHVLVKVPAFNPLRTEEARKLKLLPNPTVMKRRIIICELNLDY